MNHFHSFYKSSRNTAEMVPRLFGGVPEIRLVSLWAISPWSPMQRLGHWGTLLSQTFWALGAHGPSSETHWYTLEKNTTTMSSFCKIFVKSYAISYDRFRMWTLWIKGWEDVTSLVDTPNCSPENTNLISIIELWKHLPIDPGGHDHSLHSLFFFLM